MNESSALTTIMTYIRKGALVPLYATNFSAKVSCSGTRIRQTQANQKGSLLIESLAAVAILSVSIVIILQAMMAANRAALKAGNYVEAANVLENGLAEFILSPTAFTNEDHELVKGNLGEYHFKAQTKKGEFSDIANLKIVSFDVVWGKEQIQNGIGSQ